MEADMKHKPEVKRCMMMALCSHEAKKAFKTDQVVCGSINTMIIKTQS